MIYLVDEEIFGKTLKLFRKMKGILEKCIIAGNATNCLLTLELLLLKTCLFVSSVSSF